MARPPAEIDNEGMVDILHDWEPTPMAKEPFPQPKAPKWVKAERYFKRYRDTQKTIPLRMKLKDNEVG